MADGQIAHRCPAAPCEFETEFDEPGVRVIAAVAEDMSGQRSRAETRIRVVAPEIPLTLELSQSTDEVIAGDCPGPDTVQIVAEVFGEVADVQRAVLSYRWENAEARTVVMERVDDRTFVAEIGPFDYCCGQTAIKYIVRVFELSSTPLATASGTVLLSYCIG